MRKILTTFVALLLITPALCSALNAPSEKYLNQRGSMLIMTKNKTTATSGTLTGTFTTAVASKNCQKVIGQPMPISGFYTGNAFTLSINFPMCNTVVAMVGNMTSQGALDTLWLHTGQADNPNTEDWNARTTGHDLFHKMTENN